MNKKINCFKCKYLYITWDSNFPKGCKIIGFKSKELPSVAVLKNTGIPCQMFEAKKK